MAIDRELTPLERQLLAPLIDRQPFERPKKKQQGRGENQLEQDFAWHLSIQKSERKIFNCWAKPMVLAIGPTMTFEPDFMVDDGNNWIWLIDTKGPFSREDSRIKIKIAAERYPMWNFLIVTRPDGQWKAKEVTAEKGISRRFIDLLWLR